jgi:hypothetical protein
MLEGRVLAKPRDKNVEEDVAHCLRQSD